MTSKDPRTQELLKRMEACKKKMQEDGIWLKPIDLRQTDVLKTWQEHGFVIPARQAA